MKFGDKILKKCLFVYFEVGINYVSKVGSILFLFLKVGLYI